MKVHLFLLYLFALAGLSWSRSCPCSKAAFCNRIEYDDKEVHGIILKPANISFDPMWKSVNWTKLTTVTLVDFFNDDVLCVAHEQGVRVLTRGKANPKLSYSYPIYHQNHKQRPSH